MLCRAASWRLCDFALKRLFLSVKSVKSVVISFGCGWPRCVLASLRLCVKTSFFIREIREIRGHFLWLRLAAL
jgi:hypothetical protein